MMRGSGIKKASKLVHELAYNSFQINKRMVIEKCKCMIAFHWY